MLDESPIDFLNADLHNQRLHLGQRSFSSFD